LGFGSAKKSNKGIENGSTFSVFQPATVRVDLEEDDDEQIIINFESFKDSQIIN